MKIVSSKRKINASTDSSHDLKGAIKADAIIFNGLRHHIIYGEGRHTYIIATVPTKTIRRLENDGLSVHDIVEKFNDPGYQDVIDKQEFINSLRDDWYVIHEFDELITSSRKDDILREKEEYEAEYNAQKAKYDEEYNKLLEAQKAITDAVEAEVMDGLSKFSNILTFRTEADVYWSKGLKIRIECNELQKFEDSVALAWRFNVQLDKDGEVVKETSSWSGLKATTEEHLKSLEATLEALRYLNSVDWKSVLDKELPKFEDYVKTLSPMKPNRDFNRELKEAEIEEYMRTDEILLAKKPIGGYIFYKQTDKFYTVRYLPGYIVQSDGDGNYFLNPIYKDRLEDVELERISKDKVIDHLVWPLQTI